MSIVLKGRGKYERCFFCLVLEIPKEIAEEVKKRRERAKELEKRIEEKMKEEVQRIEIEIYLKDKKWT